MANRRFKTAGVLFFLLLFSVWLWLTEAAEFSVEHSPQRAKFFIPLGKSYDYTDILVKRAIDGDTLQLESGERLRLIGIDTPEVHDSEKLYKDSRRSGEDVAKIKELGRRAWDFTRSLTEGKRLSLEFDVERHDKYGRLLAYAYLKDGTFVNARIVEEGYASLMTFPPNVKYAGLLSKLYRQAREQRRGLWRDD
jgi:micrococcal nuclease